MCRVLICVTRCAFHKSLSLKAMAATDHVVCGLSIRASETENWVEACVVPRDIPPQPGHMFESPSESPTPLTSPIWKSYTAFHYAPLP